MVVYLDEDWNQMIVEVRHGDMNRALKELKKKVFRERILIEYKQHLTYEKPSAKRRRKRAEAILRRMQAETKLKQQDGHFE